MPMEAERFYLSKDSFLTTLFTEMPCACTYNGIVFDERGTAIDYVPLAVNPGFERVIGAVPAHVIGNRATQYLTEGDALYWLSVFAPAALRGDMVNYHMYAPRKHQTYYGTAISPSQGFFLSMFTTVGNAAIPALEVDAGRRSLRERLSSHDFAKKIFLTMPCAGMLTAIDCDASGEPIDYTIVDVNPAFCELMDTTRRNAIGKKASERHEKKIFCHWLETFSQVAFGGGTVRETVYVPRTGSFCYGVMMRPERGFVMALFVPVDSYGGYAQTLHGERTAIKGAIKPIGKKR
jgi:PAS domain-containing protein